MRVLRNLVCITDSVNYLRQEVSEYVCVIMSAHEIGISSERAMDKTYQGQKKGESNRPQEMILFGVYLTLFQEIRAR